MCGDSMANEKHVELLKSNVKDWNKWRKENNGEAVDLRNAELCGADLAGAILSFANLQGAKLGSLKDKNTDGWIFTNLERADLSNANLEGADLSHANLGAANLEGANLEGATLRIVTLRKAKLSGANLQNANLESAILDEVNASGYRNPTMLQGANLVRANLHKADFRQANLQGANLALAQMQDAEFYSANLEGADLSTTDLQGASFHSANLKDAKLSPAGFEGDFLPSNLQGVRFYKAYLHGANLRHANLARADLRGAKGAILDLNNVRGTQFDARSRDPWSVLRRTYSGPRLIFNLLFLIAFFIPYVFKVLFWTAINRAQNFSNRILVELENHTKAVGELITRLCERASLLGADAEAKCLNARISESILDEETVNNFSKCLAEHCEQMSVWQLVIGFDKPLPFLTLIVALITYNLLKAGLTWIVAPMRDEEERSGFIPEWQGDEWWKGYRALFWAHQVVQVMFWISFIAFVYNANYWLSQPVSIPS